MSLSENIICVGMIRWDVSWKMRMNFCVCPLDFSRLAFSTWLDRRFALRLVRLSNLVSLCLLQSKFKSHLCVPADAVSIVCRLAAVKVDLTNMLEVTEVYRTLRAHYQHSCNFNDLQASPGIPQCEHWLHVSILSNPGHNLSQKWNHIFKLWVHTGNFCVGGLMLKNRSLVELDENKERGITLRMSKGLYRYEGNAYTTKWLI